MQVVYGELARVQLMVDYGAVLLLCDANTRAVVVVERVQLVGVSSEHLVVGGHELDCTCQGERVGGGRGGGRRRRGGWGWGSGVGVGVHLNRRRYNGVSLSVIQW